MWFEVQKEQRQERHAMICLVRVIFCHLFCWFEDPRVYKPSININWINCAAMNLFKAQVFGYSY